MRLELKEKGEDIARKDNAIHRMMSLQSSTDSEQIKELLSRWQKASKQTRDWTKANQLLEELGNLIK